MCLELDLMVLFGFFSPSRLQSYSSQGRGSGGGAGDEDYEIPPITPPNHADPSLLHLMEHEAGYPFHALPHNGLLNTYSYPELPALMMSNMLGQDTHLLSGPVHSVSTALFIIPSARPADGAIRGVQRGCAEGTLPPKVL